MWPFRKKKIYKITYGYPGFSPWSQNVTYVEAYSAGSAMEKVLRTESLSINILSLEEIEE